MDVTQTHPLEQLNTVIQDTCSHFDDYRKNPGDFTRNRKLPVDTFIKTVLNMEGERIDAELVKAFPDFDERMSESAFEQQKAKLSPAVFEDIFHNYNKTMTEPKTLDLVSSYRVFGVDGSDFNPPYQKKSKYALPYRYGRPRKDSSDNKPTSQIHGNMLYDLLNCTYEDAVLQPRATFDEHSAAIEMIERIDHNSPFITIADRGYEGFNFIEHLNRIDNCFYIIRAKNGGSAVKEIADLPDKECDIDITFMITTSAAYYNQNKDKIPHLKLIPKIKKHYKTEISKSTKDRKWDFEETCKVTYRVVKFKINDPDSGKEVWETLITNLNRFEFPVGKMKDMYRLRWGIETSFRNLKYALGAVQFHSRKDDFVEMELFAHFTMYNAVSRCINQVSVPQNTANKHTYAIDFKMAVVLIREYLRLFNNRPFGQLYAEILSYKVAVRPDRHDTRKLIKPKSPVWFVYRVA